jgi:hypothetical protein
MPLKEAPLKFDFFSQVVRRMDKVVQNMEASYWEIDVVNLAGSIKVLLFKYSITIQKCRSSCQHCGKISE